MIKRFIFFEGNTNDAIKYFKHAMNLHRSLQKRIRPNTFKASIIALYKKKSFTVPGKYFPNAISSLTHASTDPSENPITNMILIV